MAEETIKTWNEIMACFPSDDVLGVDKRKYPTANQPTHTVKEDIDNQLIRTVEEDIDNQFTQIYLSDPIVACSDRIGLACDLDEVHRLKAIAINLVQQKNILIRYAESIRINAKSSKTIKDETEEENTEETI